MNKFKTIKVIFILSLFMSYCSETESTNSIEKSSDDSVSTTLESTSTTTLESTSATDVVNELLVNDIKKAQNAIVRITTQGEYFFPEEDYDLTSEIIPGSGSGFLISEDGYIVTNNHVVSGASTIEISFNDSNETLPAALIGKSECLDLALLKIRGSGFNYFEFNLDILEVGTDVRSGGYPLGDEEFTLTDGIVSKAKSNTFHTWASVEDSFEHTAIINPGSSGGPIFDNEFKVIGVSYAGNSYNQYFAIKSKLVNEEINLLKELKNTIGFGINFELIPETGLYLYSIDSGGVFDKIGIKGGDILTKFGGFDLSQETNMKNFCNILTTQSKDGSIKLEGYRFSEDTFFTGTTNSNEKINLENNVVAIAPSTTSTTKYVKTYSREVFDAWKLIVTQDGVFDTVGRWNKSVVDVGIIGNPTILQFDTMKYMIGDLNRIVPRIDWRYGYVNNNNIDDFEIYLVFDDNSEWSAWAEAFGTSLDSAYYENGSPKMYDDIRFFDEDYDKLTKSDWYMGIGFINPTNSAADECQIYSIRGIILTLIGLSEINTDEYGENVMLGTFCTHVLTELDEEVIRLQYDVRLGSEPMFQKIIKIIQGFIR